MKPRALLIFLVVLIFYSSFGYAQISPYNGVLLPYQGSSLSRPVRANAPLIFSDPFNNPAVYCFTKSASVATALNLTYVDEQIELSLLDPGEKSSNQQLRLNPAFVMGILPFSVRHIDLVAGLTLEKIGEPEIGLWKVPSEWNKSYLDQKRDRNIYRSSVNLSVPLSRYLGLGIGWIQWYGKESWKNTDSTGETISDGTVPYNGSSFSIGIIYSRKVFALYADLHSPFTMTDNGELSVPIGTNADFSFQQKYGGALSAGARISPWRKLSFEVDYQYQGKINLEYSRSTDIGSYDRKFEYGPLHLLDISTEYTLKFDRCQVPLFLRYLHVWLPDAPSMWLSIDLTPTYFSSDNSQSRFMLGSDLLTQKWGFHTALEIVPRTCYHATNFVAPYS